jgi:hypothetical protein
MRASLLVAVLCAGCLEKIEVGGQDGGVDASAADGSVDASGPDAADAGAGGDAGDAEAGDGGDGGVANGPLRFGTMQVPNDQISTVTIWGRSTSEMYAGTANGNVLAFDPTGGWQVGWHEPSNFGIEKIRGTASKIFVASTSSLHVHGPNLGDGVQSFGVGRMIWDLEVIADDDVVLVAEQQTGRGVYRYDGDGVDVLNDQLDVAVLYGVFSDQDGTLFVCGNGKIFRYSSFTWTQDPIAWPAGFDTSDIANFDLYDLARVGAELVAVGEEQHVLRWDAGAGEWKFVYEPMAGEYLGSIGALSAVEAYAVGRSGSIGPIVRFADGVWSHADYDANHNFFDLWVAGPDEIFAAGVVGSTFEPVILRGFR